MAAPDQSRAGAGEDFARTNPEAAGDYWLVLLQAEEADWMAQAEPVLELVAEVGLPVVRLHHLRMAFRSHRKIELHLSASFHNFDKT